jgi:hypothetical protein
MRLLRRLAVPASESQLSLALAASMVVIALLLWGVIYQSNVITYQRDLIRVIWSWKYTG